MNKSMTKISSNLPGLDREDIGQFRIWYCLSFQPNHLEFPGKRTFFI